MGNLYQLNIGRDRRINSFIFVLSLVLVFSIICLKILNKNLYTHVIQEDGIIESAQCLFYFLSFIVALIISFKFYKSGRVLFGLLYTILSLGLLFIAGEEISWGQRIFNIATPAFFEINNAQKELNVHNIGAIQPKLYMFYILVGGGGAFTAFILPKGLKNKFKEFISAVVPDNVLFLYFFPVFIVYLYFAFISKIAVHKFGLTSFAVDKANFITYRDQEPAELLLSLGLLLFLILVNRKQRSITFSNVKDRA